MDKRSKRLLLGSLLIGAGLVGLVFFSFAPKLPSPSSPLIIYSTEGRSRLKRVFLSAIQKATESVDLQIYGLTDKDLIHALSRQQAKGRDLRVIYDPSASRQLPEGLATYPVHGKGLMHRKNLIIDEKQLFLGSANFTPQSLKMHGNVVVGIYDPVLADFFRSATADITTRQVGGSRVEGYLLPEGGDAALEALIDILRHAEISIRVAMFTLTHKTLIEELVLAHERGVKVVVALDRYSARGASRKAVETLLKGGIEVYLHTGSHLLHHKWALIDHTSLAMGSANWTASAFKKNQDCLLLIRDLPIKTQKELSRLWKRIAIRCSKEVS